MMREGAKKSMSFAFSMDENRDPLVMIQPGNKPETLRPLMKKSGGKMPMIWGTYTVRSDVAEFVCEEYAKSVLSQLKRFFQQNRPGVNVVFTDSGGNTLDSLKPTAAATPVEDSDDLDVTGQDPQAVGPLIKRLKRIEPRIALAPGELELKMRKALAKCVSQINTGDLQMAETTLTVIERAIARIGQDREDEDTAMNRAAREQQGRALRSSVERARALSANIARTPGSPARDKLERAIHQAARLLKDKNTDEADAVMDKVEAALTQLS
ncbi:hypothetical protein GFB49_16640 [Epibacterium sp. SM1979]|uniref:Uncharacterized protein n=2 Tax=Tritonibacter litoralis TaxID=2662264 RepID=A0A843YN89_9RHOB|nr:hypothetical protein [Tritonibacter litoralis]